MQKILALTVLVLLCGAAFASDDHPKAEAFFGYTYTRVNSASNIPAFSANGGTGAVSINFNRVVGFVSEIGAVHNGNISDVHLDTTLTSFLFGPRLSIRKGRVTPFFHVLLGGVHGSTSSGVQATIPPSATQPIYVPGAPVIVPGQAVTLRAVASQTAFAWAPGGGIDIRMGKH